MKGQTELMYRCPVHLRQTHLARIEVGVVLRVLQS